MYRDEAGAIDGAVIEPKKASVAVHYRLVLGFGATEDQDACRRTAREYPDELKVTPGKMVYEIQPKLDWDRARPCCTYWRP